MLTTIVEKVRTLSTSCEKKVISRHILFFVLTLIVVSLYGYYFGTFDQSSHIPFLKKTVDPTLFPGDHFFDLRFTHYSFFWLIFIPFYKTGLLEVSTFVAHVVTVYLTVWAVWKLSFTLFKNALTSLLATTAMIFPHFGFSGFPFFEFSILNRTFALPIELFALSWYFENKTLRTFFVLGLMFNFHVISVNFLMAMILLDIVLRIKEFGFGRLCGHLAIFLLGASPVLIWKFSQSGVGLSANKEWFDIMDRGVFSHLFHFASLQVPYINLVTLGGISTLVLFFVFIKSRNKEPNSVDRSMMHFVCAGIIILLVQLVASYMAPSAIIIAAQITRVGVFIVLFCYLYGAHHVAQLLEKQKPHVFLIWVMGLLLSFTPLVLLVLYFLRSKVENFKTARFLMLLMSTVYVISLILALYFKLWSPGIYIFPQKNAFNEVQIWAKNKTPKDTIFITPPEKFWIYETEWRVLSERSSVSTISELLEAAFDPNYIKYWKPRFEDVAPGALAQFKGNFYDNLDITKQAFYSLNTQDLVRIARKYHASYVVIEKPYTHDLPVVYENEQFRVYMINY
jgi:hypothetical protein